MAQKGQGSSRESTSEKKEFKVVLVGDGLCGRSSLITTYTTGVFPESWTPTVYDSAVANTVFEGQKFQLNIWDCSAIEVYDRLRSLSYINVNVVLICYDVMRPSSFNNVFQKWYPEVKHYCDGVPIILVGCKTDLRSNKFLEEGLWSMGQKPIKYTQEVPDTHNPTLCSHFHSLCHKQTDCQDGLFLCKCTTESPIILVGCKTDLRSDKFLEEGLWLQGQKPIKYTQGEEAARKISAAAYLECSAKCNKNVDNVFREAARQALMAKRVKHRVRKSESRCALS